VIPCFVSAAVDGRRPVIYGDGEQTRDFIYVQNAVKANLLAADAQFASGRVINIAAGRSTSLNVLWNVIRGIVGCDLEAQYAAPREGDVRDSLADLTLASELLGYAPEVDLDEGLARTIASFRT